MIDILCARNPLTFDSGTLLEISRNLKLYPKNKKLNSHKGYRRSLAKWFVWCLCVPKWASESKLQFIKY